MRFIMGLFIGMIFLCSTKVGIAEDYRVIANQYIQDKSKITGSLDLYDENLNKVRNLKLIMWGDSEERGAAEMVMHGDFRDIGNGDVLDIAVLISDAQVSKVEIAAIKKKAMEADKEALDKKFSQDEVQTAITDYIIKKSKFSKTFDFFDPGQEKFLKLTFDSFAGDMRHFGILYIQTATFLNTQTSDKISLDITAENVQGELKIKTVKAR